MPAFRQPLADPSFRRALTNMVRRRVPESDAEDIVQSALAEALASPHAPTEAEAMRKWIWGVARNKIVDFYRRTRRETAADLPDIPVEPEADEHDLLRWARSELPPGSDAPKTLEWMLREGEGDKLETIAHDESLPAPRVRQRVSRMRRHLRARWAQQAAALAALGVIITMVVIWALHKDDPRQPITRDVPRPDDSAREAAREIRRGALGLCNGPEWKRCLDELERAKALDPAGDTSDDVQRGRDQAHKMRERDVQEQMRRDSPPVPSDVPSAVPSPKNDGKSSLVLPAPTGTPTAAPLPVPSAVSSGRPAPTGLSKPTKKPSKMADPSDGFGGSSGP